VEEEADNPRRSYFLLESDPPATRVAKLEANVACANMVWSDCFVVVGMSFECAMDNSLLTAFGKVPLPVEVSRWLIVDPDEGTRMRVCANIQTKIPRAVAIGVPRHLDEWLGQGLPELQDLGVLSPARLV